jgi:hypothetical protein
MGLTLLYGRIGQRIHREVLGRERAAYGEQIVVAMSRQLVVDFGRGLFREEPTPNGSICRGASREQEIVATLSRPLSWSHFSALLPPLSPSNGNSTRRWPGSKAGACVPFVRPSTRCSMSARRCQTTRCNDPPGAGHRPQQRRPYPRSAAQRPLRIEFSGGLPKGFGRVEPRYGGHWE